MEKNGTLVEQYAYDGNGNRTSGTAGGTTLNGTYDGDDKVLTYGGAAYTHAAGGELKTRVEGGQTTTYAYDAGGNLRTVALPGGTTLEYVIDGRNRRVGKRVNGVLTKGYLYDGQLRIVAELDGANNITARCVYGTRVNVPEWMEKGGETYRIITDHLGSPRLVVNAANGAIVQRMDYDSWGNITNDTNAGLQIFGYAGGLYDADTKLTRFGARDYDAHTGRWTAKDPIGFRGRSPNLYSYVGNDPVGRKDPRGLWTLPMMGGSLGVGPNINVVPNINKGVVVGRGPSVGDIPCPEGQESGMNFSEDDNDDSGDGDKEKPDGLDDYPEDPDDWVPPEGWEETPTGEKTGGKHRQWKGPNGEFRRWDSGGRLGGKERGPHWHDWRFPGKHIGPN